MPTPIKLASIRLVTKEVERLVSFYAMLTGLEPTRRAPGFAEVHCGGAILAISSEELIARFNGGAAIAASNKTAILEFEVDDVDGTHLRLEQERVETVQAPTTMPWGNRSLLVRDPDGGLVNVFSRPKA